MSKKKCIRILIVLILLILIAACIYFSQNVLKLNDVKISTLSNNKNTKHLHPLRKHKVVLIKIHMSTGKEGSIGIEFATPYKTLERKEQLIKYSSKIKNDFIINVSEARLKTWVDQRNFDVIKAKFMEIASRHLDEPVKEVFLSLFFYE